MSIIPKGKEPINIKKRIDVLFSKINEAYPDRIIIGLEIAHKKWADVAREISRQLGYESKNDFLVAYGYKIEGSKGGRPKSTNIEEIILQLQNKYPNGSPFQTADELFADTPEYLPKLKTIKNKANEVFGMPFGKYLLSIGLIRSKTAGKPEKIRLSAEEKAERRLKKYKAQINEVITELKKRYPDSAKAPGSFDQLKLENEDLPINRLSNWILVSFNEKTNSYLEKEGLINQNRFLVPKGKLEFAGRNFLYTGLEYRQEKKVADIILARGGNIQRSVGRKTDFLIFADYVATSPSATAKYRKAKELISNGIQIQMLSYSRFLQMVSEYDHPEIQGPKSIVEDGANANFSNTKRIGNVAFYSKRLRMSFQ